MKKKLKGEAGFTLVEMLVVAAIMVLLGLMVGVGMKAAMRTYRSIVAQSEVELLLSTAVDALADDLRYARDVQSRTGTDLNCDFTYTSDSFFGEGVYLDLDSGRIVACKPSNNNKQFLSTGAYGSKTSFEEYQVTEMKITLNGPPATADPGSYEITFTIVLTVTADSSDGTSVSASTPKDKDGNDIGVTVRCLNPMIVTVGGAGS